MRYESPPMPVNLSTSGNVMKGIFADSDGDAAENVNAPSTDKPTVGPSFSSDDLLDVNQLFEIRGSQ